MMDLIKHNFWYKVTAFAIALLIWSHVRKVQHPTESRYLEVPLKVVNQPDSLQVVEMPQSVKVVIRGLREEILKVHPSDIQAQVDLTGAKAGHFRAKVSYVVPPWLRAEMVSVEPPVVEVVLDEIVSHIFDIEVTMIGELPSEYGMGQPEYSPHQATVTGRAALISQVRAVFAKVDLSNRVTDIDEEVALFPVDRTGVRVSGLTVQPATARVHIDISQKEHNKLVPVEPVVVGTPAEGYEIEEITTEPSSVTLSGSPAALRKVQKVSTERINIAGTTATTSRQVNLRMPSGLRLSETSVRVTVVLRRQPAASSVQREEMRLPTQTTNRE